MAKRWKSIATAYSLGLHSPSCKGPDMHVFARCFGKNLGFVRIIIELLPYMRLRSVRCLHVRQENTLRRKIIIDVSALAWSQVWLSIEESSLADVIRWKKWFLDGKIVFHAEKEFKYYDSKNWKNTSDILNLRRGNFWKCQLPLQGL